MSILATALTAAAATLAAMGYAWHRDSEDTRPSLRLWHPPQHTPPGHPPARR